MKERPILFNDEMVRTLLDGRKTQARRLLKPQPGTTPDDYPGAPGHWWPCNAVHSMVHVERELQNKAGGWEGFAGTVCPFGQPGDRLWVREAHGYEIRSVGGTPHEQIAYRASKPNAVSCYDCNGVEQPMKWRPSIHMPRWACRLLLEVTAVRVERLQDISRFDACREGIYAEDHDWRESEFYLPNVAYRSSPSAGVRYSSARHAFEELWASINGPDSWAANPWVWVVEFRRIEAQEVAA
ncbi:hypothetical protein [Halomonas organivorans]|uniref:Morphogenetic protein n=1 Tax=Halomonas organivorans TaxID=257772 RepID=A0A7W5G7C1_9GAMM|nr:hypothetical protein [Halomonas organivorans]MBB3142787.1 hypothetical protein [Halomonas organivorans]